MMGTAAFTPAGTDAAPPGQPRIAVSDHARHDDDFLSARRHSGRVRALKIALPALGVMMAGGFAAYSYVGTPAGLAIDIAGTAVEDGKLVMASPKLDGFTKENLPYAVGAARAIQDLTNTAMITLEKIDAKLPYDGKNFATIHAPSGLYDRDKNTLSIDSEMSVSTTDGMMARFQSALVEIGAGTMTTGDPVEISLDGSRISAGSMAVTGRGKVVVFGGRVNVTIDGKKMKTAEAGGGSDARN